MIRSAAHLLCLALLAGCQSAEPVCGTCRDAEAGASAVVLRSVSTPIGMTAESSLVRAVQDEMSRLNLWFPAFNYSGTAGPRGWNGVNECGFLTEAALVRLYGRRWDGAAAYTLFRSASPSAEIDVVINPAVPLTEAKLRRLVRHEFLHALGLNHSADWWSAIGTGVEPAEYAYLDDVAGLRRVHGGKLHPGATDLGVYLATWDRSGKTVVPAKLPGRARRGGTLPVTVCVEHPGLTTLLTVRVWFYLTPARNWAAWTPCGHRDMGVMGADSRAITTATLTVPATLKPGRYYVAAWVDGRDMQPLNNSAWTTGNVLIE